MDGRRRAESPAAVAAVPVPPGPVQLREPAGRAPEPSSARVRRGPGDEVVPAGGAGRTDARALHVHPPAQGSAVPPAVVRRAPVRGASVGPDAGRGVPARPGRDRSRPGTGRRGRLLRALSGGGRWWLLAPWLVITLAVTLLGGPADDGDDRRDRPAAAAVGAPAPTAGTAPVPPAPAGPPVGDLPGWRHALVEDFTTEAPLGTFPDDSAYRDGWLAYDGLRDTTGRGLYDPRNVLSVTGGSLDWHVHTADGVPRVSAVIPRSTWGQVYGRYSIRFRADSAPTYKMAFMLWPDSDRWPDDGEIDFPEGDLDQTIFAASALAQPWTGRHVSQVRTTDVSFQDWHVATTEWTPGRVEWFLDGRSVATASLKVPDKAMHWVLQVETSTGLDHTDPAVSGHVQVDWVSSWTYAPGWDPAKR